MSLIKCPECGKDISDKAIACPNCGCPVDELSKNINVSTPNVENLKATQHDETATSNSSQFVIHSATKIGLNIAKLILQATRWFFTILIVLCAIALFTEYGMKGILTFIFLIACGFFISPLSKKIPYSMPTALKIVLPIILFLAAVIVTPSQDAQLSSDTDGIETEIEVETLETTSKDIIEEISTEPQSTEIIDTEPFSESEIIYTDIFDLELKENWSSYVGQYIRTAFEVGRSEDGSIESSYDNGYLEVYPDNYRDFEYGDYIVITGKVSGKTGSYVEIVEAHIEETGTEAASAYSEGLSAYNAQKEIEAAEYEASFKDTAETVSYENLARYPETYEGKEVKITVSITQVEKKDSLLFADSYIAKMDGNEIAIYDNRDTKEPKLLEGDRVIIFGRGNGLTEIKSYDKSGIIPKTIDSRKIPSILVEFIELK